MTANDPVTELDQRYSSDNATPVPWSQAVASLETAEVFWISSVRANGQPHVTPMIAVWLNQALYFCTGPTEQKARNLIANPHLAITTGCNTLDSGLDLVIEGDAAQLTDKAMLQRVADQYLAKYGSDWTFTVTENGFNGAGGFALVFEVIPTTAYGFGKGDPFSHTRWLFRPLPLALFDKGIWQVVSFFARGRTPCPSSSEESSVGTLPGGLECCLIPILRTSWLRMTMSI
jgi:general stress protein 26